MTEPIPFDAAAAAEAHALQAIHHFNASINLIADIASTQVTLQTTRYLGRVVSIERTVSPEEHEKTITALEVLIRGVALKCYDSGFRKGQSIPAPIDSSE